MFSVGGCPSLLCNHFVKSNLPILITEDIGFVWAAVPSVSEDFRTQQIFLLGPMFTSEMTSAYLHRRFRKLHLPPSISDCIMHYLKDTPTVSPNTASSYASMLHYTLNQTPIKVSDVAILHESMAKHQPGIWGEGNWHGSWMEEQCLFRNISEGRLEDPENVHTGTICTQVPSAESAAAPLSVRPKMKSLSILFSAVVLPLPTASPTKVQ